MVDATQALFLSNGIDGTTGEYLLPPLTAAHVSMLASPDADMQSTPELSARHRRAVENVLAVKQGVDPADLAQTGWGIVVGADADPETVRALRPLLDHRREQASQTSEGRYREFVGPDGYRSGETKQQFLRRHGAGPGPVDPDVVPYYLMLVGSAAQIPFPFQYHVGVQHAVGRVWFDDAASFRRYAEAVVEAECVTTALQPSSQLGLFATRHEGDVATESSADNLVTPLASALRNMPHVDVTTLLGPTATKPSFVDLLSGSTRPDVVFAATHGVAFPAGHPRQRETQGALLCQEWRGPGRKPDVDDECLSAADIERASDLDLTGMVAFIFACFGAGTPSSDSFHRGSGAPAVLSPRDFLAALPQSMLGREGGALAVVGHVDRSWGYSFVWPGVGSQIEGFRSALGHLLSGYPIGSALEYLSDRYAELAVDLGATLEDIRIGRRRDDDELARLWTACADAQSFVLIGDPAARLAVSQPPTRVLAAPGVAGISQRTHAAVPAFGADQPDRGTDG